MGGVDMKMVLKVLRKDISDSVRPVFSLVSIFIGIYLLLWVLFTFVFGSGCGVEERLDYFWILASVFCMLLPGTAYGHLKDEKGRAEYLLLPASKRGKYSMMVFLSVFMYPAVFLLAQGTVDTVLTFFGGYSGSIWRDITGGMESCLLLILLSSSFLLGNIVFERRRVGRTLLTVFSLFLLWNLVKRQIAGYSSLDEVRKGVLYALPPVMWWTGYRILFHRR